MEVKSTSKYVRLSPKKARDVAREIQGMPAGSAMYILNFTPKKAAQLIGKTLKTAMADAHHNFKMDAESLTIKEAVIGIGPALKRFKPRAKGSAGAIRRPTSHIFITLTDEERPAKKSKSAKAEKAEK